MTRMCAWRRGSSSRARVTCENLVVGVWNGRPVYMRDVAEIRDGPGEFEDYVRFHRGLAWSHTKEEGAAGSLIGGPSALEPPAGHFAAGGHHCRCQEAWHEQCLGG